MTPAHPSTQCSPFWYGVGGLVTVPIVILGCAALACAALIIGVLIAASLLVGGTVLTVIWPAVPFLMAWSRYKERRQTQK